MSDPGPCPICGTAHTACRADSGPITIDQLATVDRGAIAIEQLPTSAKAAAPAPLVCDIVQATLPPGEFTTGTYRGKKRPGGPLPKR